MANFKIMRNGLNTEIVGDPHIGQSSEDVTVEVTDDGTYSGYEKKLYYSYGYRNQIYRAIADKNSSNEFVIPMPAFLEPGMVKLSLELSNGTNKPTCNACFIIATNGAKSVAASDILPDEETWQSYIQSYIKSNAEEFKGDQGLQGVKGNDGNGIKEIKKTSTDGLVDTYTIEFNDGTTSTFTVTNGDDNAYKPAVDALGKRIDNLILSSGSDSSAEVIDARTGYDGTVYDTLGTAIRTQVNNLNNHIKNIKKVNIFDKTDITRGGYLRGTTGADINFVITADGAFYANQIWDVKEGDIIRTSYPYMGLTIYDATGKLIAKFSDEQLSHVVPSGGVKLRYSSTVTSANYLDNAMITINFEMPETYIPHSLDSFPTYEDSLNAKNFNDLENKYNELENKKTYVILRFDGTGNEDFIEDRRYAVVHDEYGYNCTISVGYTNGEMATSAEQFRKLMKYGIDFGIYSNNNPPSLDILSSNSQEAISICDTYVKNATEAAKAIGAYCPVTWLCRQSNSGYALELALKKYGYMLASGIYHGDTNTGLIENSTKFTLQTTGLYPNTISTAISRLDTAVEKGYDIAILTHKFYDTVEEAQENYGCTEDIYRQFLSAVKSYVDAGKVEVLTYSEYISKRKDNAVLRSKESQRIANWIFN